SRTARAKRPHIRPSWIYAVATAKPIGTKGTAMKTLEEMFPDQNVDAKFELALMEALLNERLEEFLKDHNCSAAPEDVKELVTRDIVTLFDALTVDDSQS
ncbi:MAG: hypothetical protein ACLUYK_11540, partial [Eggerthella lenta]